MNNNSKRIAQLLHATRNSPPSTLDMLRSSIDALGDLMSALENLNHQEVTLVLFAYLKEIHKENTEALQKVTESLQVELHVELGGFVH